MSFACESDREIHGDGGFAYAAFSCADRDDVLDAWNTCGVVVLGGALLGLISRFGLIRAGLGIALEFENDFSRVVYEVDDESEGIHALLFCAGADELLCELAEVGERVAVRLWLIGVSLRVADADGGIG